MHRSSKHFAVTADTLKGCRFFDGLERDSCTRIARLCEGRTYAGHVEIVRHMEASTDVYFIVSGSVEASVLTWQGKEVSFQSLASGGMFGELAALDGGPRTTSVVTEEESALLRMPGPAFKALIADNPVLAERVMQRLCSLARHLCEIAFESRAFSVPTQVRREIYRELRSSGVLKGPLALNPAPSHGDVAGRVGTTREQVTRVMSELKKQGLLRQGRRSWQTDDVAALMAHLKESFQAPAGRGAGTHGAVRDSARRSHE